MDGYTGQLRDALQIKARLGGQFLVVGHAYRALRPARHGFVHRLAAGNFVSAHGQNIGERAIEHIASAKLELAQAVQHIELGNTQTA